MIFLMYCYCNNNPIMYTDPSGYIAIADDIAFLGITLLAISFITYASYISAQQFSRYSQDFYRGIQKSLSQTWNWITILFKSATQVVNKAIKKCY